MRSLKSRLAIWVFLPTLLISAVDLVVTYENTGKVAALVQQQLLKGSAKIISEQLSSIDGGYEINVPPAAFELFATEYEDRVYYSVRSKSGLLIAGGEELPPYQKKLGVEQEQYYVTTVRDEPVRVIAYSHALPSTTSPDYAITQVAQTLRGYHAFRKELFLTTIRDHLMLLSIVVIGLVIAFRWTLSPLIRFGRTLSGRQPGSLEKLDDSNAPEELAPVIAAMNDYVVRLDRTLSSYEQFVANTAHHLRTSFAILTSQVNYGVRSGVLDDQQRELLNSIQGTVVQGTKVINQLLMLAAVEQNRQHGQSTPAADVNLAELVTSVIEELAPLAQQKEVELGVDALDDGLNVHAPHHLVHELVANLVDNAIQHMQGPGSVSIALRRQDERALLSVSDTGPGIAPEYRDKVFERFYRLDPGKPNSSGLGLAIVKEICDTLHAEVSLRTPDDGLGLQVDIRFAATVR